MSTRLPKPSDGETALELFQPTECDLVITDYHMPGMKGDELAARIKRLVPLMPVIMITAYAEDFLHKPGGVDALLSKPFTFEGLRKAIADTLPPTGNVVNCELSEKSCPLADRNRTGAFSRLAISSFQ